MTDPNQADQKSDRWRRNVCQFFHTYDRLCRWLFGAHHASPPFGGPEFVLVLPEVFSRSFHRPQWARTIFLPDVPLRWFLGLLQLPQWHCLDCKTFYKSP